MCERLPYTRISEDINKKVEELIGDFEALVAKAKKYGLDIRLHPESKTLALYYHDDYPDTLLVDKEISGQKADET